MLKKHLGQILVENKFATPEQIKQALQQQMKEPGKKLGQILIEMQICTPEQIARALAMQFNFEFVALDQMQIPPEVINAIPAHVAVEYKVVPVGLNGSIIRIAISDPLDIFTLDNLKFILNTDVECVLATESAIQEAIAKYYATRAQRSDLADAIEVATQTQTEIKLRVEEVSEDVSAVDAPIIKFVQLAFTEAVKMRASDIHVEPMEDRLRIRYRIDGVCREVQSSPRALQGAILSRIKIMAGMDIAEKRKPQDGRIGINILGRELDVRVSSIPATHGESIVMRLLDKQVGLLTLEELGFHPTDYKRFKHQIKKPNGIILITGPTGSGKTTTLYAALQELNRPDVKIITAENPVEYCIPGINQSQVKHSIGLTFQRILRAMLRQAPNIILVGEIRDRETAEIGIQAALTGHLVFSTLHTNDAPSAITRLLDMGVKPFLVASSIQAIMGQRLVRILCPHCKQPDPAPDPALLTACGLKPEDIKGKTIYKPVGCAQCNGTGYRGRKGVFELMEMNSTLRELAFKKAPLAKITEVARMSGMVTILEDGVRKVLDGLTTFEEVLTLAKREDIGYV